MSNKKLKEADSASKAQFLLRSSLVCSYLLLGLLTLQAIHNLTASDDDVLGLIIWIFVWPLLIFIFVLALVLLLRATKYGLNKDRSSRAGAFIFLVGIIGLVVVPGINQYAADKRLRPTAQEAKQIEDAKAYMQRRDADSRNITYSNTKMRAYLPSYLPAGYKANPLHYDRIGGSIGFWGDSGAGESAFWFGTVLDISEYTYKTSSTTIGSTTWGEDIILREFTSQHFVYTTTYQGQFLVMRFGDKVKIDRQIVEPEIPKIIDSVKLAN